MNIDELRNDKGYWVKLNQDDYSIIDIEQERPQKSSDYVLLFAPTIKHWNQMNKTQRVAAMGLDSIMITSAFQAKAPKSNIRNMLSRFFKRNSAVK